MPKQRALLRLGSTGCQPVVRRYQRRTARGSNQGAVLKRRVAKVDYLRPRVGNPCSPDPLVTSVGGFTIVELLIVMGIIIVLAGLIIGTSGYVQKKGARSRAEAEIAALSAALESYRADNGIYPAHPTKTDAMDPTSAGTTEYRAASTFLYGELTGDRDADGAPDAGAKSYMPFKPAMLQRADMSSDAGPGNLVIAIRDPFGNSYGYSTMKASGGANGYNPTFDLWSTANSANPAEWIKNW